MKYYLIYYGSFQIMIKDRIEDGDEQYASIFTNKIEAYERLIDSYTNYELFDKLKYYGILTYNIDWDCYLPDFISYNRYSRDYYIEVEDDNGLTHFRNLKEIK